MDAGSEDGTVPGRAVQLPDGRTLVVRPAVTSDVPALVALFERLSPEDRYRRFFSGFHPAEEFVRDLVTRAPADGRLLVVEVSDPAGTEVVAEAEYARLADGDAELAMTVDRRWRGWLGPFLLDALLQVADAAGIPSLRAEVLTQNRPMLALLRARGCAMAESGDPCVTAVVIGADGSAPSWAPASPHPRVLLEAPAGRWRLTSKLGEAGVPVLRCAGPASRAANVPCPLLEGGVCPLAAGADVVVHALGRDDPRATAILDAHRASGVRLVEIAPGRGSDEVDDIVAEVLEAARPREDGG